ncbi:MAG: DUF1819 domain-containing protein, partial [Deltaproteobacteria bacterium]|nr:DUF1819 domain-containing protein [Deltaproteobacteria bacterium]
MASQLAAPPLSEVTVPHTQLLRLALGLEESRCYWEHVDPAVPLEQRLIPAFEGRWFGAKSQERVRRLLAAFNVRYDAYPAAFAILRRWRTTSPDTRQLLCHWHLQLSDPVYRRFSGSYLVERRALVGATVDRDAVQRWIRQEHPGRWREATTHTWGEKLVAAASEAGLLTGKAGARTLRLPRVPDEALAYWLHLLREVRFEGTMTD